MATPLTIAAQAISDGYIYQEYVAWCEKHNRCAVTHAQWNQLLVG